jgi:hypothetical protein
LLVPPIFAKNAIGLSGWTREVGPGNASAIAIAAG